MRPIYLIPAAVLALVLAGVALVALRGRGDDAATPGIPATAATAPEPPPAPPPEPGSIAGSAWVGEPGRAIPLNGLPVWLLEPTVRRADVGATLDAFDAYLTDSGAWVRDLDGARRDLDTLRSLGPDEPIPVGDLYAVLHLSFIGPGDHDIRRIRPLTDDAAGFLWADVVLMAIAERASVDLDGHFRFDDVPPGDYVLHAQYQEDGAGGEPYGYLEWLRPVTVRPGDEVHADLGPDEADIALIGE